MKLGKFDHVNAANTSLNAATYLKKNSVMENFAAGSTVHLWSLQVFQPYVLPQPLPFSCQALNSQFPPLTLLLSKCSSVSLIFGVDVLVLGQCLQLLTKEITVVISLVSVPTSEPAAFPLFLSALIEFQVSSPFRGFLHKVGSEFLRHFSIPFVWLEWVFCGGMNYRYPKPWKSNILLAEGSFAKTQCLCTRGFPTGMLRTCCSRGLEWLMFWVCPAPRYMCKSCPGILI